MIILLTHDRFDAIKTASHRPDNVNNNARGQCFGIGNMAAMATRWLQRHRPMRDPVSIQISGFSAFTMFFGFYHRLNPERCEWVLRCTGLTLCGAVFGWLQTTVYDGRK